MEEEIKLIESEINSLEEYLNELEADEDISDYEITNSENKLILLNSIHDALRLHYPEL